MCRSRRRPLHFSVQTVVQWLLTQIISARLWEKEERLTGADQRQDAPRPSAAITKITTVGSAASADRYRSIRNSCANRENYSAHSNIDR